MSAGRTSADLGFMRFVPSYIRKRRLRVSADVVPGWCEAGRILSRVSRVPKNDSGRISINVYGLVPTVPTVPSQKQRHQGRSVKSGRRRGYCRQQFGVLSVLLLNTAHGFEV